MRHLVFNSFLFACMLVEERVFAQSSFVQTLPLPPASSVPLTSRVQHRAPPPSSSRILPVLLHCLTAFTNLYRTLVHAGRLKTSVISVVLGSSNPTFFVFLEPTCASNCTRNTPFLLLIEILWPVLVFSMHDSCGPNTTIFRRCQITLTDASGLLTSASKNLMLHFLPSQTNSSVAPPSTRIGLPFDALLSDQPDSNVQSMLGQIANVKLVAPIHIRRPI